MSLRAGTVYNVNIYDDSYNGTPVILKGGAEPFKTEEGSNDDMFSPVQTQSGLLRIVDDGKDANGNSFDILSLMADYDYQRPVTLTDANNVVKWMGYLQSITYLGNPYESPLEREFTVHCILTAMADKDVKTDVKEMKNFAYYIKEAFASIGISSSGTSPLSIQNYYFQGGNYARAWLLKLIDPEVFIDIVDDEIKAKYDMLSMLQDICRFWGWTMRICGSNVFFDTVGSDTLTSYLVLSQHDLEVTAGGTSSGTTTSMTPYNIDSLSDKDIFADISNELYSVHGYSRSTVKTNIEHQSDVVEIFSDSVEEYITENGSNYTETGVDGNMTYAKCVTTFPAGGSKSPLLSGSAVAGNASFCMVNILAGMQRQTSKLPVTPAIHIHSDYTNLYYVRLQTLFEHCFFDPYDTPITGFNVPHNGGLRLRADIYRNGEKYNDCDADTGLGKKTMYMAIGIGKTEETAVWWNGATWTVPSRFTVAIGNNDDILRYQYNQGRNWNEWIPTIGSNMSGYLFIKFMGSEDIPKVDGVRSFFITNFRIEFGYRTSKGYRGETPDELVDMKEYTASNRKNGWREWNSDIILASGNKLRYGFGIVINPDGTPMSDTAYPGGDNQPEQAMADRVSSYTEIAKLKGSLHMRTNKIPNITPAHRVTLGAVTYYPSAIAHSWRDDITMLTLIQI